MTIAQAFNEIAVAQGGTASKSGTIAGAIDALNDALAGSDQDAASTIEDAVRLLGAHISQGGGGGGSSDFTTATVTLVGDGQEDSAYTIFIPYEYVTENPEESAADTAQYVTGELTSEMTVILYKGVAFAYVYYGAFLDIGSGLQDATVSVTGNAEADGNFVTITGDCTITCTGYAN